MHDEEKAAARQRYAGRLQRFGHDPRTLGWDKRQHRVRYEALLAHWPRQGLRLLDVGCGFGDLAAHCAATGRGGIAYAGIDLSPELIAAGLRHSPDLDLRVWDWDRQGAPAACDVIVASGVFNHRLARSEAFIETMLRRFAQTATMGFAVNFMSTAAPRRHAHLHYAEPGAMLAFCLQFSRRVLLRHDYMPFEFTVVVDKRDGFDPATTTFADFEHWISPADEDRADAV